MAVAIAPRNESATLDEVIAAADWINHAIPTHEELQQTLGWLQHRGYVTKKDRRYSLTDSGRKLMATANSKHSRMHTVLQELSSQLPDGGDEVHRDEEVTPEAVQSSYIVYRKRFARQYRELKSHR